MSFFATVPDSILGLLIGTFWMTVHIECFGIQPALSYCCHHFQLNKLCIAMISDKYDDHTSQSLHATPRNHERFFMAGSQATGAGIPCQRSMVPSCGSIEPLSPLSIWEKVTGLQTWFLWIFRDIFGFTLDSSRFKHVHVPSRWRRWRSSTILPRSWWSVPRWFRWQWPRSRTGMWSDIPRAHGWRLQRLA